MPYRPDRTVLTLYCSIEAVLDIWASYWIYGHRIGDTGIILEILVFVLDRAVLPSYGKVVSRLQNVDSSRIVGV